MMAREPNLSCYLTHSMGGGDGLIFFPFQTTIIPAAHSLKKIMSQLFMHFNFVNVTYFLNLLKSDENESIYDYNGTAKFILKHLSLFLKILLVILECDKNKTNVFFVESDILS